MKLIKDQYCLTDQNIIKQEQFLTTYKCNTKQKQNQNSNIYEYLAFQYNKQEIQILEKILITEIVAQKNLKNKGYLEIVDYQQGQNSIYVITSVYLQTLQQLLKQKQKLESDQILALFKQLLQTYAYHYYMNMCHFNISPENIIVKGQRYLLKDMGFNHHLKYITKKPILQIYDSPQRIQNCPFSAKADIWSLGVILYECLTGYKPIIAESFTIYPIELDQANPFHQLIIRMTQFYECDRLSWQELYQHPFVAYDLKLKIMIDDKLYQIAQLQINALQNVDLEFLFGLNTKNENINSITFYEYKKTLQKLGVPFDNYVETLYIIQAGQLDESLEQSGLKQWMNQVRLMGLRSNHRQLQPQEKQNMLNFKEEIETLQERLNILPQEIQFQQSYLGLKLSNEAKIIIQSIKSSFEKYNTNLQEFFKRYDPQKVGGVDYLQFNNMLLKIYTQDVSDHFKKEVFNFANRSKTGIIQMKEFKELILDLDIQKLQ